MERIPFRKYNKGFREESVKLVIEGGLLVPEAGRRLSPAPSVLRNWVIAHKEGELSKVGNSRRWLMETELEMARLRREPAEVKMERDSVLCKGVAARYAMIKRLRLNYSFPFLCLALKVSVSGYCAWSAGKPPRGGPRRMRDWN